MYLQSSEPSFGYGKSNILWQNLTGVNIEVLMEASTRGSVL